MDMEEYRERIMTYPVEDLHMLTEEDPAAAIEWSKAESELTAIFAAANGIEPDKQTEDEVLARILSGLGKCPAPHRSQQRSSWAS